MWLDDAIGFFSPQKKLDRMKSRAYIKLMESRADKKSKLKYDGATTTRRGEGWHASNLSATAEISTALPKLRDRSRDLIRNNPHAARVAQVIPFNVVGRGIVPAIDSENEAQEEAVRDLWKAWGESKECDYDGQHDFYGLQRLVMRGIVESGEVLIRKRKVRKGQSALPLSLQILEADFLATEKNSDTEQLAEGHVIIQGIEFNSKGKVVAYHLYEQHPGNMGLNVLNYEHSAKTQRIPADEIIHIFKVDRPGQVRGVPWLSASMLMLRDFDDYSHAQLLRQKLASAYMGFIKDIEIPDLDSEEDKSDLESFEPGQIEFLPPGKDIILSSPPEVSENFGDYTRIVLQSIASSLGISYEALSMNLSDINYSSFRGGWLEFQRSVEVWRDDLMEQKFLDPFWLWFSDAAAIIGIPTEGINPSWISPRREMIDPTKEIPALRDAVEAGFKTRSEILREQGKHPEEHFEEMAKERDLLDSLGLNFDNIEQSQEIDSDEDE